MICAVVLEHVTQPFDAVENIRRIVKPGGKVFVAVPFFEPVHDMPHDYFRYTAYGLAALFKQFSKVDIQPHGTLGVSVLYMVMRCIMYGDRRINTAVRITVLWSLPLMLVLRPIIGRVTTPYLCILFTCLLER